jgi:hypothetical protein
MREVVREHDERRAAVAGTARRHDMFSKVTAVTLLLGIAAPLQAQWRLELARDVTLRIQAPSGPLITNIEGGNYLPVPLPAGEPVRFEFISHGSGTCTRPGPAAISQEGALVTAIVLDSLRSGVCTLDYAEFPRQVVYTFPEPGRLRLRIVGRAGDQFVDFTVRNASPP